MEFGFLVHCLLPFLHSLRCSFRFVFLFRLWLFVCLVVHLFLYQDIPQVNQTFVYWRSVRVYWPLNFRSFYQMFWCLTRYLHAYLVVMLLQLLLSPFSCCRGSADGRQWVQLDCSCCHRLSSFCCFHLCCWLCNDWLDLLLCTHHLHQPDSSLMVANHSNCWLVNGQIVSYFLISFLCIYYQGTSIDSQLSIASLNSALS